MNEDILKYNSQINEIDGLLTEKEQSLKKKIFSLAKMEALVFSDPYLTKIYDEMAQNGEEKYGYHYNETIQNMIFNDYVLNSSKYLQKYKMAIPKKKKRRDKSGINKLRHDSTVDIKKSEPQPVAETTSAGSAGGAAGYVGYAGPAAWSKSGKPMSKPLYIGGTVVGEGVIGEDHNYLTEANLFKFIAETLNEDFTINEPNKKSEIIDKTSAFNSGTVKQWNDSDTNIEYDTMKTGVLDKPEIEEKAVSKAQQKFMGMVHAVQTGELSPSKVGDAVKQAAKSMKTGDVEDFAATKHDDLPNHVDEMGLLSPNSRVSKNRNLLNRLVDYSKSIDDLDNILIYYGAKYKWEGEVFDAMRKYAHNRFNEKNAIDYQIEEDYAITKLNPLKQLGWITMPSYRFGGAAIFEVSSDDSFGKNSGADYVMGSANDAEYVLKPYGENNYIINQNPKFWQRYIKLDQNTQKVYYLDDDNKFKYLGKYKNLDLDPNKNWGHNYDNQRLLSQIESLKKQGATFKFNDSDLDYSNLNEENFDIGSYQPILTKMVKHITSTQQLVDVLVTFMKHNRIVDKEQQKEIILLAKELFNANNIQETSMIDHNPTTMAMSSDPINAQSSGMERASDMTANFDIMSVDEMASGVNDPKVQKLVTLVNGLINMAVDSDGDPIPVVDKTSTWEEPYIYEPIIYNNGQLKITSRSQYSNKPETEVILKRNMEFDGIPSLKNIANLYRKAIKTYQNNKNSQNMENNFNESTDKDRYENIIFLQGSEADEALNILNDQGSDAALEYLKQWHDYGNHEGSNELGHGSSDKVYEKDGYIMSWNAPLGYIGLQYELDNDGISEMLYELNKISKLQENLMKLDEERKPSAIVLKDRMGNENAKNFKSDLQHSGTKKIIDVTKELQYADQQTTVGDNPYKAAEDIEKKSIDKSLENVGDSTADGKHIPKRNLTADEQNEVDDYRLGLGDYKFDNKVGDKFEERMKADMGDDFYEKRQRRLEVQANQPMYNKDQQPTETKKEDDKNNKFIQNLGENVVMTGRYINEIGKSQMIDFNLNEAKLIETDSINDNFFKINLSGLGNTYSNKLNESTKKLEINENVIDVIDNYSFYLKDGVVYSVKNVGILNESFESKTNNNKNFDKIKHLSSYKPSDFINTKKVKRF